MQLTTLEVQYGGVKTVDLPASISQLINSNFTINTLIMNNMKDEIVFGGVKETVLRQDCCLITIFCCVKLKYLIN